MQRAKRHRSRTARTAARLALAATLAPAAAHAQASSGSAASTTTISPITPLGAKNQLAFDNLTSFRIGAFNGVTYAGPLGFSVQRFSAGDLAGKGDNVFSFTSFWIAPSADFFVIDRLSIGGSMEIAHRAGSVTVAGAPNSISLPGTTNFVLMPRIGYVFPLLADRFGIWPRFGLGYASHQQYTYPINNNTQRASFSSLMTSISAGFLVRLNDTFFAMLTPDLTFSLFGSSTQRAPSGEVSTDAGFFQFSTQVGLGALLDL